MNINSKSDKANIQKIENLRFNLARKDAGTTAGLCIYIDRRAVEVIVEKVGQYGEHTRVSLASVQYNDFRRAFDMYIRDIARLESDYLTTAEIYNVIKAGVNSLIERGF